jgi:hypothetical protein
MIDLAPSALARRGGCFRQPRSSGDLLDPPPPGRSSRWRSRQAACPRRACAAREPQPPIPQRDWLLARVSVAPDLTLRALQAELAERKVDVCVDSVWRFLTAEGLSFKKGLRAAEQDRPDVARKRARWKRHQGKVDPERLIFIDETWAKTNMTRTHGRAPRGERLVAAVPHGHWKTMTFLAGLRHDGIVAPCVFDGPINGVMFLAWVQQLLVPCSGPATLSCSTTWAATRTAEASGLFCSRSQSSINRTIPTTSQSSRVTAALIAGEQRSEEWTLQKL